VCKKSVHPYREYVTIIKTNLSVLFGEIIAVCYDNHKTSRWTVKENVQSYFVLQQILCVCLCICFLHRQFLSCFLSFFLSFFLTSFLPSLLTPWSWVLL